MVRHVALGQEFRDVLARAGTLLTAHERQAHQILAADGGFLGQRVVRRTNEHQLVEPADLDHEVLVRDRRFDDADIHGIVLDHVHDALGVGDLETEVDGRVLLLELAQQHRQNIFRDGGAGADDQNTADIAGQLAHLVFHFAVERDDLVGVLEHALAGGGEADLVVRAVEQPRVEIFLELADLEGHGRLRHVQRLRGLGEAQEPRYRVKYLKSAIRHGVLSLSVDPGPSI